VTVLRDPDAEYFQAVEEFFVSRRGDPLFLSNADWLLIRRWRESGLPLRIVQRGIADALQSHELSWSRKRKVGSLRYCAAEVEAAAERWRLALQGGQDEPALAGTLRGMADALARVTTLGPTGEKTARALAAELLGHVDSDMDPRDVEPWLRGAEERLLAAIEADTPEDERRAFEGEIARDLAPYGDRLPEKVLAQVREESRARRRLEAHGLRRLSLWSL
jgi:hypothetical protein